MFVSGYIIFDGENKKTHDNICHIYDIYIYHYLPATNFGITLVNHMIRLCLIRMNLYKWKNRRD